MNQSFIQSVGCFSVMVWTEIKLPFNPPPLHMTSLWCTSHRELSLVRCAFSCVTCSQSELLSSASTPTGQPVVERSEERERGKCFYEWKSGGEDNWDEQTQILTLKTLPIPHLLISIVCSLSLYLLFYSLHTLTCYIRICSFSQLLVVNWNNELPFLCICVKYKKLLHTSTFKVMFFAINAYFS